MMNGSFTANTTALLAAVAIFLFVGTALYSRLRPRRRRRARRSSPYSSWQSSAPPRSPAPVQPAPPPPPDLRDPAQQMHAIARVDFECTPLLNKEEARLLPILESVTRDLRAGHRVMAQTSLGELLRPTSASGSEEDRKAAFASINSKRLDFAVIDRSGRLVLAVEYQGTGHHQGQAFMRDAVKREVLRRAGVPFLEVAADFETKPLRDRVLDILTAATMPNPANVTRIDSRSPYARADRNTRASASSAATCAAAASDSTGSSTATKRKVSHQSHISGS